MTEATPTTTGNNDMFTDALHEVASAEDQLRGSLVEEGETQLNASAVGAVNAAQADVLRSRAQRERNRGIKNLEKRHEGVASVVLKVALNERVIGSAFERWYAGCENGIFVLGKRAHLFVGDTSAEQLMNQVIAKIQALENEAKTDLEGVKQQLSIYLTEASIKPQYVKPASEREVQLRTQLAHRLLKVVLAQDQILMGLVQLHWNGEIETAHIEAQENKAKKGLRDLATFLSKTMRGMRSKVEQKAKSAPAPEAGEAANSASIEQQDAA
ncbi:hypothetical protein [Pseudoduganella sp. R-34]|uniref:hypothetical protein n=1 Tax=Pseudoduganella sp. R-34 TaxID=3404062 RepID=UPI003CF26A91